MRAVNSENDLVIIAGNRPEIIKLSELVRALRRIYKLAFVYSGQHYSSNMKEIFLKELDIKFDYDIGAKSSEVSILRPKIREVLQKTFPNSVLVYGDTNTTLAGALAAKDQGCQLIHLEAGLRCFDLTRIEERNRIYIDSIADYFLAPTELNRTFLKYENKRDDRIFVTGNLVVDVCKKFSNMSIQKGITGLPRDYILLTLHRAEFVDQPNMVMSLPNFLSQIEHEIIFPVHPRTRKSLARYNISLPKNVTVVDAVGYSNFLALMKNCKLVLTDSGGVQEEAVILKKPCITLMNATERQETLLIHANRLFSPFHINDKNYSISAAVEEMLSIKIEINPYGYDVTKRVINAISKILVNNKEMNPEIISLPRKTRK